MTNKNPHFVLWNKARIVPRIDGFCGTQYEHRLKDKYSKSLKKKKKKARSTGSNSDGKLCLEKFLSALLKAPA